MIKIILIIASFLPLFLQFPYLLQAWSGSRLDHWDWIFYLIGIPAAVWAVYREKFGKFDFYALIVLAPALLFALFPSIHHINALAIIASIGVIFSAVWLAGAWQFAYKVLPAAVIFLLGTPSSSYRLSLLMMCAVYIAWAVKFFLVLLCFVWIYYTKRTNYIVKCGTLCFISALFLSGMLLMHSGELYFEGTSFIPEFPLQCGEFWGRTIQPDENTMRFFATSKVRQYRYTANDIDISVLAVQCGKNIHEIHPASHCLRTSMWTVHSEKTVYLHDNFAVTEIDAQKGGSRILVWVWYSSEDISTSGFLGFRRHFKPDGNYHTFQISLPQYANAEKSRNELKKFMQALRSKNNHGKI